jgi:Na+/proline symporter
MSKRFSQILFDHICQQESTLRGLFALCSVVFLLLFVSLGVVTRGTATYVITVVDLVSVTVIGSIAGTLLIVCQRRRDE